MKSTIKFGIFLSLFLIGTTNAQNFEWARSFGGSEFDSGRSICVDGLGNVYTTGLFEGTVDFDPGAATFNLTSGGDHNLFIHKMDASGNFIWARSFGNTGFSSGQSISTDDFGNVYTVGNFDGTVDFDPGTGTYNLTSSEESDIFVHKMDSSGNFLWAKSFEGPAYGTGRSIHIDFFGNIYTTGQFRDTVDFDPGAATFNLASAGGDDIFIHKMDSSGNFIWARSFGNGITGNSDIGYSISTDASGNVFTTGYYRETVDFDPGSGIFNLTSLGGSDVFIQKMDGSGNFLWAKSLGGIDLDTGASISVDAMGNTYTSGRFQETVDFDPGAGVFELNSMGDRDIFIQKMDGSGNFLWSKSFGSSFDDYSHSICVDSAGNVYTTGYFEGTVDFDPGTGIAELSAEGDLDVYVQKMDASGNFLWVRTFGGSDWDIGLSLCTDNFGSIYTTGYFRFTVDFDPGGDVAEIESQGSGDIFIQKMSTNAVGLAETYSGIQVTTYPNPTNGTVQLAFEKPLNYVEITVHDIQGKTLYTKQYDIMTNEKINIDGSNGIYFLTLKTNEGQGVIKLIKQ